MSSKKIYRDKAWEILSKRKKAEKNIQEIENNMFLLPEEKKAPTQRIKDALYKEISDIRSSEEYKNAKDAILNVHRKETGIKKLKDALKGIEAKITEEETRLFDMKKEIGDFEPLWLEYAPKRVQSTLKKWKDSGKNRELIEHIAKTISYNKDGSVNILPLKITFYKDITWANKKITYKEAEEIKERWWYKLFSKNDVNFTQKISFNTIIKPLIPKEEAHQYKGDSTVRNNMFATWLLWFNYAKVDWDLGKEYRLDNEWSADTEIHYLELEDDKQDDNFKLKTPESNNMKCYAFGYKKMAVN